MRRNAYLPLKRACDGIFAVGLGLVLLLPCLLVALAIRLDSPGPALFTQERIGKDGRPFRIYKFRTMVKDAPNLGPALTQDRDPRITRMGSLLRRTSLDELPQLLNILRGDMSFIGPRPEVPSEVAHYTPEQREVLVVRPGLSGWAQIHGRDDLDIPTKLTFDLDYIQRLSVWLDLYILWRTPGVLLSGKGIKA